MKPERKLEILRRDWLKKMISDEGGIAFFGALFEQAPPGQSPFATDPYITAFECGKLNVGLWLMAELESAKPGLTAKLTKAYNDRTSAIRNASADTGDSRPYDPADYVSGPDTGSAEG